MERDTWTGGRAGWTVFGGLLTMLLGVLNLVHGATGSVHPAGDAVAPAVLDPRAWRWLDVAVGILACVGGAAVCLEMAWGRLLVVRVVLVNAVVRFVLLSSAPLAGLVVLWLDAAVLYAMTVRLAPPSPLRPGPRPRSS